MPMRDFHAWMTENGKEVTMDENGRRTGIRSLYPAGYSRGQYTDQDNRTHAADAAYYQSLPGGSSNKK